MTEEKDIALVADYLEDRMEAGERESVEKRLQEDEAFKALFDDIKELQTGLEGMNHKHLLARMDKLEATLGNPLEQKAETKTVFWNFQRIAAAFIGLAIVALASWYGLSVNGAIDGAALFAQNYKAYDNVMVPITRGEEALTLLEQTFEAYELKEYQKADGLFDQLLESKQKPFVSFYAGITAMEVGKNEKTERLLNSVIEEGTLFAEIAQWYLALHHLKKEEYKTTIILLESLEKTQSTFSARATELLKEIR